MSAVWLIVVGVVWVVTYVAGFVSAWWLIEGRRGSVDEPERPGR